MSLKKPDRASSANRDGAIETRESATPYKIYKILRAAVISAFALILLIATILVIVVSTRNSDYANAYAHETKVGYFAEYLGTTKRKLPQTVTDGGLECGYPVYGAAKTLTDEQKSAVLEENGTLCAGASTYDKMDADGNLYLNGETTGGKLYKHTAADGMYFGNVSDTEPAVIKKITMSPRGYRSYGITGLYAPAGEVIKIEISEQDMDATDGITIHIGQALYNGQANNIWAEKSFVRMPVILNTMTVDKSTATLENGVYTAYVGSFFGGPVYIRNEDVTFSVIISGAVNYSHFILGVTTEEEFARNAKSSAPYFDLEVWEYGVLHSGPAKYAKDYTYQQLYDAAILWEKISLVSTRVTMQGIVFLYDPFVAAGAAVAFPGRQSVNCPASWMTGSLDYENFVTSGAWGNVHEYHHNFQSGWGCGYTGEVTNNALNLVTYSLFTKISQSRQITGYGGDGLSGWNRYTSATWALNQVNCNDIADTNGLAVYATLLHNLGQDAFINSAKASGENYFNKWAENTHLNFSYFTSLTSSYVGGNISSAISETQKDYPMFVPVSCVYQTGRSYMYDNEKRFISTMQPYDIPAGSPFTVDLTPYAVNSAGQYESGSILLPNGFSYKIKTVDSSEINGTFTQTEKDVYLFTPNEQAHSGKIYVTIEITKDDDAFDVQDVDLVLEFNQSHESNKNMLERTTYTFAEGAVPESATQAYESGYEGFISKIDTDNVNPTQNSNTDIWQLPNTEPENAVYEVRGKIYIKDAGKYRIVLRGRWDAALYLSFDGGQNYTLAAVKPTDKVQKTDNHLFTDNGQFIEGTFYDYEADGACWIYFKSVLICTPRSFIGLGITQWTVPQYTTATESDEQGNVITHYYDESGNEVTAEQASDVTLREPAPDSVSYLTAYRNSYEFTKQFESDYFYTRSYSYSYRDETNFGAGQAVVSSENFTPASEEFALENLFVDSTDKNIHTKEFVTAEKPVTLEIDLGKTVTANTITLFGYTKQPVGNMGFPVTFTVFAGVETQNGVEYTELFSQTDFNVTDRNATFAFDETAFRYYKITVSKTNTNRYFALNKIEFAFVTDIPEGRQYSPDSELFTFKGDWETKPAQSTFGYVYSGNRGSVAEFTFTGTRFAILSSNGTGRFEVFIDGKRAQSIPLKDDLNATVATFISAPLSEGDHTVIIRCTYIATVDSIVLW